MNVLVVDDHTVMRQGVQRLLAAIDRVSVIEAGNARDAMLAARRERPDLVVLDINLKETSGLDLLRRFRLEWPTLRVVVFSMYADVVYARSALRLGALGFVSKSAPAEELVAAVRRGLRGEGYVDQETAQALERAPAAGDEGRRLSGREAEVLRLLADGKSLSGIAETLGVAYKTVANQCTRIKEKLGIDRTSELIRFAIENRGSDVMSEDWRANPSGQDRTPPRT
ncbi:DNA-binding NarL/FixJ family response regulator [Methylorubrum rhodinum]|uniref:DNA-binding NarL/FixJ family response regulator n=1 Tax=Methylorubrum rhodinum TaxID=29428 RepID=A0A840ZKK1_9HYPH|nr:response regulator transcription factor [Methylorubrum rhodinum]MBB5757628.1 DNA-binding NarL/FixJ family response regulator [Methylorubrum rhodinum]